MFETGILIGAIVWALSGLWLVISIVRLVRPRWRRSAIRQTKLAVGLFVLSFIGIIWCNQFVYLDYGLASREGLTEARAARKAKADAKRADAKAKAATEQALAATEAEKQREAKAKEDAKQAAIDAEQRKKDAEARALQETADRQAARAKKCSDTTLAFVMSQEFVKRNLKAPSTAEFPWITDDQVAIATKPDCGFRVLGWVDAQNGFGAQIRSKYRVDMKLLDDKAGTWQLTDISIR